MPGSAVASAARAVVALALAAFRGSFGTVSESRLRRERQRHVTIELAALRCLDPEGPSPRASPGAPRVDSRSPRGVTASPDLGTRCKRYRTDSSGLVARGPRAASPG